MLAAERASLSGLPAQVLLRPGPYDLRPLAAGGPETAPETAPVRQLFAALPVEAMAVGGILGVLRDAVARLQAGDLLSLALVSRETDPAPVPGVPVALGQRLEPAGLARTALPLVAIGGMTPQRARTAAAAGADLVAVVSALTTAADPAQAVAALREAIAQGQTVRTETPAPAWPLLTLVR